MDLALAILLILIGVLYHSTFLGNYGVGVAGNQSKETIPISSQNDEMLLEMQAKSAFDKAFAKANASQKISNDNIINMMKKLDFNTYFLSKTYYTWSKEFEPAEKYHKTISEKILNCLYFTPDDPETRYKRSKSARIRESFSHNKIHKEMGQKSLNMFLRSNGLTNFRRSRSDFSSSASSEETEAEAADRREYVKESANSCKSSSYIEYESIVKKVKSLDRLIEVAIPQIEQTRLDIDHAFTCLEDYLKIGSSEADICAAIGHLKRLYYARSYIRKFIRVQIEDVKHRYDFKYANSKPEISKGDLNSEESQDQNEIGY